MVNYDFLISYLVPASIGAFFGILVNIIFYEYRFFKEKKLEFLKTQLTELLVPLYIFFNNIDDELSLIDPFGDMPGEVIKYLSNEIDLKDFPNNKFYLASPKLFSLLLKFIYHQTTLKKRDYHYYWVDYEITPSLLPTDEEIIKNYDELWSELGKEYEHKMKEYQEKYQEFEAKEWLSRYWPFIYIM